MANDSKSWSQSAGEEEVCKASVHCCQVEGCDADLHADKIYNQRKRLCSAHMAAEAVYKRDQPCQEWRFCFQCGKLEPLELFDGKQRSCRFRLQQRRKPSKGDALDASAQQQTPQQQPQTQPQQRKRQQKRPDHSAKRACGASRRRACAGSQSPDTQHSANEDQQVQQQLPEMLQWQQQACSAQQQGALGLQACWASAVGSSAESSVEPLAANAAGAAAAAAAAAASRRQQRLASLAAGAQEAVAQLNSLRRTSTALSAADVAVLLADKEPRMEPAPVRAAPAAAAGGCAARALSSPAALSGHIATLHQQCQELQARLDSMQAAAPAAAAVGRAAGAAAVPPACSVASGNAAAAPRMWPAQAPAAPAAAARVLKQPVSLQRHGSWESSCPSSPTSAATAVLPAASHMELVEMVVQQLEDSTATAEAAELEALLDQELRAAASMPPERARHSWASKLNQMIDSLSTAISGCAMPQASAGPPQQQVLFVPVAAAASAGSVQGAAVLPAKHLGGFVPVLNPAAGAAVPAAVVESMVDVRLVSLQQQLAQLQGMVQGLRGKFVV